MSNLPDTSLQHYLTGTSAMTIPSADTAFVDWHFVDTFLGGRASFRIAGLNFPDTTLLLGTAGVRECADVLRRNGVRMPPDATFFAANRDRAILDMIVGNLQQGRRPDHLRIEDFCDDETEVVHLTNVIKSLRENLHAAAQIRQLDEWLGIQEAVA